ncbi:c-type cytochrome [Sinorhizobium americanum]|uniref:Cytochrome c n=1 Tax=Sinorhizobium americanum TaxID=194963 RepID=A0A1L3LHB3_9HYPH|nr:cytochrome c family protein [Sinorhizobium americanum]APG89481.1 cytochrome c [Sinorhizobium americanum]OAP36173.1 cytochrome C [Sinorhizobium americanum]
MNPYVNMGVGALLGTVFVLMTVSIASEGIFHSEAPEKEGFAIVAEEPTAEAGAGGGEEAKSEPIGPLLAKADASAGEAVFKKCASCHTIEKGGPNKVGPNLWGLVNRPVASHEGFAYSAGMKTFSEGGKVVWDYDHLSYFLEAPKKHVPGTAMGFAGLKKPDERANLIAWLREKADTPAPLPAADATGATEAAPAAAPAQDGQTAAPAPAPAEAGQAAAPAPAPAH